MHNKCKQARVRHNKCTINANRPVCATHLYRLLLVHRHMHAVHNASCTHMPGARDEHTSCAQDKDTSRAHNEHTSPAYDEYISPARDKHISPTLTVMQQHGQALAERIPGCADISRLCWYFQAVLLQLLLTRSCCCCCCNYMALLLPLLLQRHTLSSTR